MIQGAVMCRPTASRTRAEAVTIPASHAAAGTALTSASGVERARSRVTAALLTQAGRVQRRAELRGNGSAGRDGGGGRRPRDLRDRPPADGGPPRRVLERRCVELRDAAD